MATTRRSTGRAASKRSAPGLNRDYGDVEYRESSIYDGPQPTRGLYRMELVHVGDYTKQGEDEPSSVQWTFRAMEGEENKHGESVAGWKASKYTTEKGAFVEQAILVACGVIKPNDSINMPYEQILRKAKPCRALVVMEKYIPEDPEQDSEWRAVLTSSFLPDDGTTRKTKDDEDDEDEKPARSTSRRSRRSEPEPEPDEDEAEEAEDEDEDERVEASEEDVEAFGEELAALKLVELKAKAKAYGVTVKRGEKSDAIIDAILDTIEEDGFLPDDAPEEDEPEEEPEPPKGRARRSAGSSGTASKSRAGSKRGYDDDPPF